SATARAVANPRPVHGLQLLLDGRPAPVTGYFHPFKPALKPADPPATWEWTLKMPPGSHRLSVLARSTAAVALPSGGDVDGPPRRPPSACTRCASAWQRTRTTARATPTPS